MSEKVAEEANRTELNSILTALAEISPQDAKPVSESTPSDRVAQPVVGVPPAVPSAEHSSARKEANKFYNNTFDDPAWHISHQNSTFRDPGPCKVPESFHPDTYGHRGTVKEIGTKFFDNNYPTVLESHHNRVYDGEKVKGAPKAESMKGKFQASDQGAHGADRSSKFHNNDFPVVHHSHSHTVHTAGAVNIHSAVQPPAEESKTADTPLPPPPSKLIAVQEPEPVASLPPPAPAPAPAPALPPPAPAPAPAGMSSKGVAQSGIPINSIPSPIETRDYYSYSSQATSERQEREHARKMGRPRKSSRYLKEYTCQRESPLEYSKDYVHTEGKEEMLVRHMKRQCERNSFLESAPNEEVPQNSRTSRKVKRMEAARDMDPTKYGEKLGKSYDQLRHALARRDASQSGFVNFDEFRAAMIQADVIMNNEEYKEIFHQFTNQNTCSQVAVPVRSNSASPRNLPAPGGDGFKESSQEEKGEAGADADLKERYKGVVGNMSEGRVLHIEEFITNVRNSKVLSEQQIQDNNDKEKRRVFFKALHAINKAADPSKMFRHLDGEQLGHMRPELLRQALTRLGTPLSDGEFNTLLRGVGFDSDKGSASGAFIDLHEFDRKLHEELAVSQEDKLAAEKAASEQDAGKNYKKMKKPALVAGITQNTEHEDGLTLKVTEMVPSSNAVEHVEERGRSLSPRESSRSHSHEFLGCLQPHLTEFTRMVESKHTKESSMKWSKLKYALQKQPHGIMQAFTRRTAAHAEESKGSNLDAPVVSIHDLETISISDLDSRMRSSGIILGNEDQAILNFHLKQNNLDDGKSVSIKEFCEKVDIPYVVRDNNQTNCQAIELEPVHTVDGGIFCSSAKHGHINATDRKFGTSFYDATEDATWMLGMRKRRVAAPFSNTRDQNQPWKFLAQLAHGSDALWPAVPKSADTHKPGSSFHFSKRLHFFDDNVERSLGNLPLPARAGRSSSAPPRAFGKRPPPSDNHAIGGPGKPNWSNSVQFEAAQATFAAQEAAAANSPRDMTDAQKLSRWASSPLYAHYVPQEQRLKQRRSKEMIQAASSAVNNEGTVSSRAHVLTQYQDKIDSTRHMKHTLRKRSFHNQNVRPTRPFALDGES